MRTGYAISGLIDIRLPGVILVGRRKADESDQ